MKPLFNVKQLREWDMATCAEQDISSFELLLRASAKAAEWILARFAKSKKSFLVIAGLGNNGGDGFAIAHFLWKKRFDVVVASSEKSGSDDRQLAQQLFCGKRISLEAALLLPLSEYIIIDAFNGFGLSRPISGLDQTIVDAINAAKTEVISIDLPSGLPAFPVDVAQNWCYVQGSIVLTFQVPKLALYSEDLQAKINGYEILDIGLSAQYKKQLLTEYFLIEGNDARTVYKPRKAFCHKGNYGRLLIIGSRKEMPGAAILSGIAALRSGVGTITIGTPECNRSTVFGAIPEAMWRQAGDEGFVLPDVNIHEFDVIACGMGLLPQDLDKQTFNEWLLTWTKPILLDAGALRMAQMSTLKQMKGKVVLTPHPGEFDQLFGKSSSWYERTQKALAFNKETGIVVVIKGTYPAIVAYSRVMIIKGANSNLAKGGSGDVLSGIISSLLANGYGAEDAALLGNFVHQEAARQLAKSEGLESLMASHLALKLGDVFLQLNQHEDAED